MSTEFGCPFKDKGIKYRVVDIPDDGKRIEIDKYFQDTCQWIDKAFNEKKDKDNVILIHCEMGRSRSASLTMAWLMMNDHFKMTLKQAYMHVKGCRSNIFPNDGFLNGLEKWELKLYDGKSTRKELEETGVRTVSAEEKAVTLKTSLKQVLKKKKGKKKSKKREID